MLLPSGNPIKYHEEVLSLQPMIPPEQIMLSLIQRSAKNRTISIAIRALEIMQGTRTIDYYGGEEKHDMLDDLNQPVVCWIGHRPEI